MEINMHINRQLYNLAYITFLCLIFCLLGPFLLTPVLPSFFKILTQEYTY